MYRINAAERLAHIPLDLSSLPPVSISTTPALTPPPNPEPNHGPRARLPLSIDLSNSANGFHDNGSKTDLSSVSDSPKVRRALPLPPGTPPGPRAITPCSIPSVIRSAPGSPRWAASVPLPQSPLFSPVPIRAQMLPPPMHNRDRKAPPPLVPRHNYLTIHRLVGDIKGSWTIDPTIQASTPITPTFPNLSHTHPYRPNLKLEALNGNVDGLVTIDTPVPVHCRARIVASSGQGRVDVCVKHRPSNVRIYIHTTSSHSPTHIYLPRSFHGPIHIQFPLPPPSSPASGKKKLKSFFPGGNAPGSYAFSKELKSRMVKLKEGEEGISFFVGDLNGSGYKWRKEAGQGGGVGFGSGALEEYSHYAHSFSSRPSSRPGSRPSSRPQSLVRGEDSHRPDSAVMSEEMERQVFGGRAGGKDGHIDGDWEWVWKSQLPPHHQLPSSVHNGRGRTWPQSRDFTVPTYASSSGTSSASISTYGRSWGECEDTEDEDEEGGGGSLPWDGDEVVAEALKGAKVRIAYYGEVKVVEDPKKRGRNLKR